MRRSDLSPSLNRTSSAVALSLTSAIFFAHTAAAQGFEGTDRPIGRIAVGAFYEVDGGPGLDLDLSASDLFGRGIEAEASFSTTQRARNGRIGFTSMLESGWDLGVAISGSQSDRRGVSFDYAAFGAEVTLGREVFEGLYFSTAVRQVHSRISGVTTDQPVLVDEGAAGWQIDRSVGYGLRYRSAQVAYDGGARFLAGISQDLSGFGGDRSYLISRAYVTWRHGFADGWLRTRADLEVAGLHMRSGSSRISERFHLGDYMRGFRQYGAGPRDSTATGDDALGGNYLAVARFDAEVPLTAAPDNRLFGGAFLDIGSVWGLDDARAADGGTVDDQRHWRAVAGVNMGWDTGRGRVNLTLADTLRKRAGDRVMKVNISFSTQF